MIDASHSTEIDTAALMLTPHDPATAILPALISPTDGALAAPWTLPAHRAPSPARAHIKELPWWRKGFIVYQLRNLHTLEVSSVPLSQYIVNTGNCVGDCETRDCPGREAQAALRAVYRHPQCNPHSLLTGRVLCMIWSDTPVFLFRDGDTEYVFVASTITLPQVAKHSLIPPLIISPLTLVPRNAPWAPPLDFAL
jgi:hypothetical protein